MKKAVICFTRIPIPGQTKTRLTPLLSGEERAALHTAFLRDLAGVFIQVDARLYVVHTPEGGQGLLRDIFPQASGFFPQEGEGLGPGWRTPWTGCWPWAMTPVFWWGLTCRC